MFIAFELYVIVGLVLAAVILSIPSKTLFRDGIEKKKFIWSIVVTIVLWPLVMGFVVVKHAKKGFAAF